MASKYTELADGRWRAALAERVRLEYTRDPLRVVCGTCGERYAAHRYSCPTCSGSGGGA